MASSIKISSCIGLLSIFEIIGRTTVIHAQPKNPVTLHYKDVIKPTKNHTGTVFFLHAAGDAGEDAKNQITYAVDSNFSFPHLKILFPTGPEMHYHAYDGLICNVWFNRPTITIKGLEDLKSIDRTFRSLRDLIDKEVAAGIPLERIAVGGFSMGGSMALHVAYRHIPELAGVFTMSSYLSMNSTVYKDLQDQKFKRKPPLYMTHSEADTEIPFHWGHLTYNTLHDLGVRGNFYHEQNAIHEISPKQITKIHNWLSYRIPEEVRTTTMVDVS